MSSAGAALAGNYLPDVTLRLCGVTLVEGSRCTAVEAAVRERLDKQMKQSEIDIDLDLGVGDASAEVFFADLGHEYITINADYHT